MIENLQIIQGTAEQVTPLLNQFLNSHPNAKILSSAVNVISFAPLKCVKAETLKPEDTQDSEIKISKAAKELAEAHNIDLTTLKGTGNDGAITKTDVQLAIENANDEDGGETETEKPSEQAEEEAQPEETTPETTFYHAYTVAIVS